MLGLSADMPEDYGIISVMLSIALLPFVFYCAFLAYLHFRKTPTVLNGSTDFTLLAWGLFGLITFGPGRLLIPIYVFAAWGVFTWVFWIGFYFLMTIAVARLFRYRLVIYHCQRELVLPPLYTRVRQIDPKTEWAGNVLSLHGLGVQWFVTCDQFGGHILFQLTNPAVKKSHLEMLHEQLATLCKTLEMPKNSIRWVWGTLAFGLLCISVGLLVKEFPTLIQDFSDHWVPR